MLMLTQTSTHSQCHTNTQPYTGYVERSHRRARGKAFQFRSSVVVFFFIQPRLVNSKHSTANETYTVSKTPVKTHRKAHRTLTQT